MLVAVVAVNAVAGAVAAVGLAARGPVDAGGSGPRLVRERVLPAAAGAPGGAAPAAPAGDGSTTSAPAPPAPGAGAAAGPPVRATGPARPDLRTRAVRAPAAAAAPVVKAPPPRPNRTSEAPTQPEAPGATGAPSAPTPVPGGAPPSTVRYAQDFPDPFVFRAGPYWYALSTQRGLDKVPVIRSTDLVRWEARGDALAALPRWSRFGSTWAPAVLAVPAGFVLFYTTTHDATGLQCLSRAFSPLPEGPFVDVSREPLVCQTERGGSIDPSPFRDAEGRPWLVWKSEGTLDGEPTRLWSQPLTDDGRSLTGEPRELLRTADAWEGPIIEAPTMVVVDGRYHLFYSGNRWETSSYGTGHAICASPAGPCTRTATAPVVAPHPSEAGAGGGEVFRDLDGTLRLAYHAWDPTAVGYPGGLRRLRIGTVRLGPDGSATVEPLEVPR